MDVDITQGDIRSWVEKNKKMGAIMSFKSGGDVEDVAREQEDIAIKVRERCRGLQVALEK